jgi:hypothetical protein
MKKYFGYAFIVILLTFCFIPNVSADFTCAAFGSDVLIDDKIANVVSTIIRFIQVVIPVILVIYGMVDFIRAIMAQKEDEIKKGQQTFIKRLIAAAFVFFIIAIVKMVIGFVASDTEGIMSCANCFLQGASDPSCEKAEPAPEPEP